MYYYLVIIHMLHLADLLVREYEAWKARMPVMRNHFHINAFRALVCKQNLPTTKHLLTDSQQAEEQLAARNPGQEQGRFVVFQPEPGARRGRSVSAPAERQEYEGGAGRQMALIIQPTLGQALERREETPSYFSDSEVEDDDDDDDSDDAMDIDADSDSDSIVVCSSCAYAYPSAQLGDGLCEACTNDPENLEPWCEAYEQYHADDH
jgi:hypothetical protein